MQERDEVSNTEAIKSPVWDSPDAVETIVINEGARVAAYFNPDGMIALVQEEAFGDDHLIVFEHKHIHSLIRRLQELASDDPMDFMSDGYRTALLLYGKEGK